MAVRSEVVAVVAAMRNAVLVTRDDELRWRVEGLVPVRTPEQVLKDKRKD